MISLKMRVCNPPFRSTRVTPTNSIAPVEKNRIVAAGGYIEYGRVNGPYTAQRLILTVELLYR